MAETYYVYQHISATGDVLYVGCTKNFRQRMLNHRRSSWHDQITQIIKRRIVGRAPALKLEWDTIIAEQPIFNVKQKKPPKKPYFTRAEWREKKLGELRKIISMRDKGALKREIAEKLGVSMNSVSRTVRVYGS